MKFSWSKADGHQLDWWPYTKQLKVSQVKRKLIGYRWCSSCGLRWLVAPELLASPSPLSCDKDAPSKPQVSISTIQLPDSLHDLPIQLDSHHYSLFIIHIYTHLEKWSTSDLKLLFEATQGEHFKCIPLNKEGPLFFASAARFMDQGDSKWLKRTHYAMTQGWLKMTNDDLLGATGVLAPQCGWESQEVDTRWLW